MKAGKRKGISLGKFLLSNYLIMVFLILTLMISNYFLNYRTFNNNIREVTTEAVRLVDENIGYYKEFQSPESDHIRRHILSEHEDLQKQIAAAGIPSYSVLMNIKSGFEERLNANVEINILTGAGVIFNTTYPTELGLDISKFKNARESLKRSRETGKILLDYPVYERSGKVLRAYTLSYIPERDVYLQTAMFLADLKVVKDRLEKVVELSKYIESVEAYIVYLGFGSDSKVYNISSENIDVSESDANFIMQALNTGEMIINNTGNLFKGTSKSYYILARVPDDYSLQRDLDHRLVYKISFDTTDEKRYGLISLAIKLITCIVFISGVTMIFRLLRENFVKPFNIMLDKVKKSERIYETGIIRGESDLAALALRFNEHLEKEKELVGIAEKFNEELEKRISKEVSNREANEQLMVRQSLLAAMGEMTQSMAFLWREPLAVLSKYIDDISVMVDASEHDYKELERITVKCMEQVLFMSSTIEDFRFFFKPSHRKKLFEVRGTVQEIMCLIAPHLQSENITLIFSCFLEGDANPVETELLSNLSRICGAGFPECVKNCGSFGLPVCGYPAEFKLAILSIFHNSRRLLEKSGGMEKQIMLNLYDRGDSVMIDVFDNSRGMSEEDIQAVYNPYSDYAEDGMIYFNLYMALTLFETNMKGKVSFSSTLEGLNINILVPKRVSECRQSLAEEV